MKRQSHIIICQMWQVIYVINYSSDSEEDDEEKYYAIKPVRQTESRLFRSKANVYQVDVKKFPEDVSPLAFIPRMFDQLIEDIKRHCQVEGSDKIRMTINHPGLKLGVFITWRDVSSLTGDIITQEIERVMQSNDKFKINDGQMRIDVTVCRLPTGSGRKPLHHGLYFESENMCQNKQSIVKINNTKDSMCMARAIVVGKCNADKDGSEAWKKNWEQIRKSDRPFQTRDAMKLLDQAKIPHDQITCGIEEYKKIQAVLAPEYLIKVHNQHPKDGLVFPLQFKKRRETKVIHLYWDGDNHYDSITTVKGFLGCIYYCEYCDVGYNHRGDHRCPDGCDGCYSDIPCPCGRNIYCTDCKRTFRSPACFDNHKLIKPNQKKSICQLVYNCVQCGIRIIGNKKNHVCPGQRKCKFCKEIVGPGHQCYIQKYIGKTQPNSSSEEEDEEDEEEEQKSEEQKSPKFIFYDFESSQETGEHKVNFCVAQRACDYCMDLPSDEYCPACSPLPGGREMIFEGEDTLSNFCGWVLGDDNKGTTCIAHNFGGYDGQFILRHILEKGTVKPDVIMNGNTIMRMSVGSVKFLDSYLFLHMRLANFPKTFGLTEMKKGYFPHLANTQANQNYVGTYFPAEMYIPGQRSEKDRTEFYQWYNAKKDSGAIFDFRREMEEYCRSDVDILRRGCACFRKILIDISGVDPFTESCTIAQTCSKVWRKNYMPEDCIAIIPPEGYPNQKNYSIKAVRWIQSEAKKYKIEIRHALNGGEEKICGHYVDGYHQDSKTVFEFYGCYWHGCPRHFPDRNRINPHNCRSMQQLYAETLQKKDTLKEAGYRVIDIWECHYDKMYKEDADFRKIVDAEFTNLDPLRPRDALFGGRTNSTKLFHEIDETSSQDEIKYIDVCSLYPYICKYGVFPLGHPTILSQENIDKDNIRQYCGLIKCKVLPPTNLYHPVLPYKTNNKLMFPLCRTCAEQCDSTKPCKHDKEEDRALVGTWVSIELFAALERGYRILDVYEVWNFPETTRYDKMTGLGGIFAKYIDVFLKLKQEASGYPDWCKTEEDMEKFKRDYLEVEGILLELVEKYPGLRAIAKIMLNSLWGKLAQRENMTKTEYISEPSKYFDLVTNPSKIVKNVDIYGEQFVHVNWEDTESLVEPHTCSNVVVASFVTAQARLKLYDILKKLNERVLYFDTDSIIYEHKAELWNPTIGDRLGEWTDEVPGARIVKFVGMGPKNYGYEYVDKDGQRKSTCKVKGLTLDYNTSQLIHFHQMLEWAKSESRNFQVTVNYNRIRKHKDRRVTTERQSKTYRFTYNKRVILPNGYTVPYGYKL